MPNNVTHCYFGDLVAQDFHSDAGEAVKAHLDLFYMGANGPDLFFTFRELGFGIPSLSNLMQFVKTYEVFESAVQYMRKNPEDTAAYAYFLGLFCHYALDRVVHPYVNYAVEQGFFADYPKKYQKSIHTIIEIYFDEYIIRQKQNLQLVSYTPAKLVANSKADRRKMAQIYNDVVFPVYNVRTSEKKMAVSVWIVNFFHKLLNDKKGRKRAFYEFLEKPIGYAKLTCFLKPVRDGDSYDFLNNGRRPFRIIRNKSEMSTENFDEMTERARKLCLELTDKFDKACKGGESLRKKDFAINYEGVMDPLFT
ncbi:MAG: zinc dependent phospholipase C family protein [Christensenellales bacterium]|jgi:hypothetical protein